MRRRSPHKSNAYYEDVKKLISEVTQDSSDDSVDQYDLSFEEEVIKPIIYDKICKESRSSLKVSFNNGLKNSKGKNDDDK
jgi:hypothetical protein